MKKLIATVSIVTALGAGAFSLNSVLPASARGLAPQATIADPSAPGAQCGTRPALKDVLDKLVTDGKITQDQEDSILQAVQTARSDAKASRPARPNGQAAGPRLRVLEGMVNVAAGKIGVTPEELKTAIQGGQSAAQVATAHGVAPADVEQAIVDAGNTKIDEAVTAGKLTDQQATFLKARLPELANTFVNHVGQPGCGPRADTGQQRQLWQRQLEQHRELELLSLQSSGIGPEQHPLIAILTEAALGRLLDGGLAVLPSLRACLAAGYRPIGSEVLFSQLSRP